MARYNPFQFVQEVRQETAKVTWPTRKETWITTVAVLVMVTISALFFMIADQLLGYVISLVLQIGLPASSS
ncbi:MAG: preprotein translocase subunit SecE [Pseudomonadota bacterium]